MAEVAIRDEPFHRMAALLEETRTRYGSRRRRAFWSVGSLLASRSLIILIPMGALFRSVYRYQHGTVLELVDMDLMAVVVAGTTPQWWRFLEQQRLGVLLVSNGKLVDSDGVQRVHHWPGGDDDAGNTGALNAGEDRCPYTDNCVDGQRGAQSSQQTNAGEGTPVAQEKAQGSHTARTVKKIEAKQGWIDRETRRIEAEQLKLQEQ